MQFQQPPLERYLQVLNLPCCRQLALTTISYLDVQDIQQMVRAFQHSKQNYFLFALVETSYFISNYLNKVDKSIYYEFYSQPQCQQLEIQHIAVITYHSPETYRKLHRSYQNIKAMLQVKVPIGSQQIESLDNLLVDPDMPLPKIKRQTQGMFCKSAFQNFLVDQTFHPNQDQQFCVFQNLRQCFCPQKQQQIIKKFLKILKDKKKNVEELKKIMKVRYTPFEITHNNYTDFLIQENELHNLIVGIFALTDIMIEATYLYVSNIKDPLFRLMEIMLRYSVFRNFVIATEEYLSFIFSIYESVYHDAIEQNAKKPKYKFWRPALTKWFKRMDCLRQQAMPVYMHCLAKLRSQNLIKKLSQLCVVNQQKYGYFLTKIELADIDFSVPQVTKIPDENSQLWCYFDQNPINYQIIIMDLQQYLIDISINEQTVHWCGHSNHQVQKPYLQYEQSMINFNRSYMHSLLGKQCKLTNKDKSELLSIDLEYLSVLQIKNRTIKQLLDSVNHDMCLQGQDRVTFNFFEIDDKLQYFNRKAFILAQVDNKQRPFYSIFPLCTAQKLIEMVQIDTNDSQSNGQLQSQLFVYESEEDDGQETVSKPQFKQDDYPAQADSIKTNSKHLSLKTKKRFAEDDEEQTQKKEINYGSLNKHEDD